MAQKKKKKILRVFQNGNHRSDVIRIPRSRVSGLKAIFFDLGNSRREAILLLLRRLNKQKQNGNANKYHNTKELERTGR